MTERGAAAVARSALTWRIGPSRIGWEGDALVLRFAEWTVPWPGRIRGRLRLWPTALPGRVFPLTPDGAHRWWPIAPLARVEVELEAPALRFTGHGYLDANEGSGPLEHAFSGWDWSRAGDGREAAILYEGARRDGGALALALRATADGRLEPIAPPPRVALARSGWGLARATRADPGAAVRILRRLEDAPFYARALLATRLLGRDLPAVHETLSLDRFARRWVQLLLPFRMPRRAGPAPHRAELPEGEGQHPTEHQDPLEQHDGAGAHGAIASLRAGSRSG
jgi:carotenoid 1,2-hydratase